MPIAITIVSTRDSPWTIWWWGLGGHGNHPNLAPPHLVYSLATACHTWGALGSVVVQDMCTG